MSQTGIDKLCTPDRKVRETYYSDTYRAKLRLGGVLKMWDITHIQIPFSPDKEKVLRARFDIRKSELPDYYKAFTARVEYQAKLLKKLHSSGNEQLSANIVKFAYVDYEKDDNGISHYYIITDVMQPLVGSEFVGEGHTTLLDLLQICVRFIQVLKLLQDTGVHIGSFDFDSIYLCAEGEGRTMMKIGSLLYAGEDNGDVPALPGALPNAIHDTVRAGECQSIWTDLYAIFSMMWSLMNGKHYTDRVDLSMYPKYAPESVYSLLKKGVSLDSTNTLKQMHNETYALIKKIKRGEMKNVDVLFESARWPKTVEEVEAEDSAENTQRVESVGGIIPADLLQGEEIDELVLEEDAFVLDQAQHMVNSKGKGLPKAADDLSEELLKMEENKKKKNSVAKKRMLVVVGALLTVLLIYCVWNGMLQLPK